METHNIRNTGTYTSWIEMRQRCYNPNNISFHNYGGRGIDICDRWDSFRLFLLDMGERPLGHTLDRKDVDVGYYKENCRWATAKEQIRNTRKNRLIDYNGETKCLAEWAELYGLKAGTLARRLKTGWSMEDALTFALGSVNLGVARNEKPVNYNGESKTLKEWAKQYGIKYPTLHKRINKYGMTMQQALSQPLHQNRHRLDS